VLISHYQNTSANGNWRGGARAFPRTLAGRVQPVGGDGGVVIVWLATLIGSRWRMVMRVSAQLMGLGDPHHSFQGGLNPRNL